MSDDRERVGAQPIREHTLILKLTDRPGAMELIAATFAHRGISLSWTLGSNGAASLDGHATVLVHFAASPARKEAVQRALARLSRMVSVSEPAARGQAVQKTALLRLAPGTSLAFAETTGCVAVPLADAPDGESLCSLVGFPDAVDAALERLRASGDLRDVTQTVLAL